MIVWLLLLSACYATHILTRAYIGRYWRRLIARISPVLARCALCTGFWVGIMTLLLVRPYWRYWPFWPVLTSMAAALFTPLWIRILDACEPQPQPPRSRRGAV